mgnify:CR=1 FL=1
MNNNPFAEIERHIMEPVEDLFRDYIMRYSPLDITYELGGGDNPTSTPLQSSAAQLGTAAG